MNRIDALLRTVLYEGYALYPYRPSALKNQRRFAFGVVYPRAWAERALEAAIARVEVIATALPVTASIHYLHDGREQRIDQPGLVERDGLTLSIEHTAVAVEGWWRVAIEVRNATPLAADATADDALRASPASLQVVLRGAGFVSSIDPPAEAAAAVAACRCTGLYPVLVGTGAMLASPIILPDQPEIAPQSPGDFFDGLEIDEMLALRILTMTDAEKAEACRDPRVAALIERTERLGLEATARLHGITRTWPREGSRVCLRPTKRADAFDLVLAGKRATVVGVERDLDGRIHCAVALDDDPGADLPGHRFYFAPDELEVIA